VSLKEGAQLCVIDPLAPRVEWKLGGSRDVPPPPRHSAGPPWGGSGSLGILARVSTGGPAESGRSVGCGASRSARDPEVRGPEPGPSLAPTQLV
jgi:hypothetical protein